MFIYITQRPPVKEIVHRQKWEDVDRREAEEGILNWFSVARCIKYA